MISIVVPVYNVEKYLSRCIDSLLAQEEQDFEIILVDDGSTDRSGDICNQYAERDQRIRVIHQKNGGLSAARNAGMAIARGEFIGFIDSDDWIEPDMYSSMRAVLEKEDVDFAMVQTQYAYDTGEVSPEPFDLNGYFEINNRNISDFNRSYGSACNKLYRRKNLVEKNIDFPVGIYYEDNAFLWEYECLFNRGYALHKPGYNYFMRAGSITQQKLTPRALDALVLAGIIKERLCRHQKFEQYFSVYMGSLERFFKLACKRLPREMRSEILPATQKILADIDESWLAKLPAKSAKKWLGIKQGKLPRFLFLETDIKHILRSLFS